MTQTSKLQPSAYPLPLTSCRCGLCTYGCHAGSVLAKLDLSSRQRGGPQGRLGGGCAGWRTHHKYRLQPCSPARRTARPKYAPHRTHDSSTTTCLASRILLSGSSLTPCSGSLHGWHLRTVLPSTLLRMRGKSSESDCRHNVVRNKSAFVQTFRQSHSWFNGDGLYFNLDN